MNKIKAFLGYTAAFICILLVPYTFINMKNLEKLFAGTGLKPSPKYSGGNIVETINRKNYVILIHKPVFSGLISETKEGFIQVDFKVVDKLPPNISEKITIDGYNFTINLDTLNKTALIKTGDPNVKSAFLVCQLSDSIAVRINLINNNR